MKGKKVINRIILILAISVFIVIAVIFVSHYIDKIQFNNKMVVCESEVLTLKNGEYDGVFFSMFPIGTFSEQDFETYRTLKIGRSSCR